MAFIVSIETSTRVCSVALHKDEALLGFQTYLLEKSHSHLLPTVINELLAHCDVSLEQLDALAVSSGPGSYTGLRIGVSTAKGLAFGLDKPIISVPTLDAMAEAVKPYIQHGAYLCPMIDARRMEVYCQLIHQGEVLWSTQPLVVMADAFAKFTEQPIYLFGDGASKTREVLSQENIKWIDNIHPNAKEVGQLALAKYEKQEFEDLAYFEPQYLKAFQAKPARKLI